MLKVGLTGGIGSGKSTVSEFMEHQGIVIVDADLVARQVVEPGSAQLAKIHQHYGNEILNKDGTLARAKLRSIIFQDENEKQWLEALLHPAIRSEIQQQLKAASSPYTVLVSPLLLETHQDAFVDEIVVVDVPEDIQINRASKRDGNTEAQIKAIIASQIPRQERIKRADEIIDNSSTIEDTLAQTNILHQKYIARTSS